MILDILNPSDACMMVTEDLEAAAMACALLGMGQLGLRQLDAQSYEKPFEMPLFLFGGHEAWWLKTFGHSFEDGAKVYRDEKCWALIHALNSIVYGTPQDLSDYKDALELITQVDGKLEFQRRWNEKRRGSTNDIAGRAQGLAKALAKDLKKPV